ncbi:FtsK/SpoIIIE family DNA translocase [Pyxidicoccus xibeiensis]|uniref:FtsK/SpoIIIE family DNA translocase n=1 Tax=Pyxidicoccus xibeiensis TaxID=2906759 RepID=UPI0020A7681F|nr:DNA translocase FtsK 4TM domain-containing protein [Pyxidicoccus xibeiensis]MCP3138849.1 DNA translocase FtsK 4TM domain-containing protein [Pyxidicoccus xibeiensis]
MTAKKGRAEKAVLSRQEIATRRRQLADKRMKAGSGGGVAGRAITGVFLLATSLLALLSVATFDAKDRVGPGFRNAVGPMGHLIAESLRGLLGVCAYLIPMGGLYTAMVLFVGNRERKRGAQVVALVLMTVSVSVLAQLMFAGDKGWAHPPGGALGAGLGGLLEGLFSTVGTVILVTAVSAAALIVGTQYTFLKLCSLAWAGLCVLGRRLSESFHVFWEAQKVAYKERQERAAQEKEEEAAFLAQIEADEEELAEAERLAAEAEAAEAEAMAEEAVRLAKQNEKEQAAAAKQAQKEAREREKAEKLEKRLLPAPREEDSLPPGAAIAITEKPPVRAEKRPAPGADPAWAASFLAPEPRPVGTEDAELAPRGRRRQPNIVTGPSASTPPVAAAALAASRSVDTEPPAPAVAAPLAAAPVAPAAPAAAPAAIVPAPASALARMPLIVEPKAPPKPTAKKSQDQFEFVGDRKSFSLPPLDVLECDRQERTALDKDAFLITAEKLRAKLADFGIVGEVVEIRPGPVVTMYEFLPGPGIKVSKIASLADDLAMAMEAMRVRIVAPIPGKGVVGIEVPNKDRETVYLKEIAEQDAFNKGASKLTMCVGKDIEGMPYVLDLAKAPHLLIAGTTGSGKSVAVNSMIMSILLKATPEEVRFIMVDPKMLELSVYEGIPHLLLPVVTDPKKAALALRWAVEEMERRYQLLSEAGVRNIAGYNKLVESTAVEVKDSEPAPKKKSKPKNVLVLDAPGSASSGGEGMGVAAPRDDDEDMREAVVSEEAAEVPEVEAEPEDSEEGLAADAAGEKEKKQRQKLPYIVVIIDELADLMMVASREVETYVARLAQMARASGIHLMVATQRPSTDVVTGVIKANFPTRVSFMLRSKPDSMTILGTVGAEALLGMGDMLIMPPTSAHLQRVHGAFVSENEIKRAVDHLKAQGKPVYDESILKPRDEEGEGGGGEEDELSDELYDQALATVSEMRAVSISMLQRKMRIGYNRAARMIERMERDGVVGAADGAKPREVLIRGVGDMPGAGAM